MLATIAKLKTAARQARAEIIFYSQNFTYAGPISKKMAVELNLVSFAEKFSCFADNRDSLVESVKVIDKRIEELVKTEQVARTLEATGNQYVKSLDATSVNGKASARAPASAKAPGSPSLKPVAKTGPSSITGTEKIGESDRALLEKTRK